MSYSPTTWSTGDTVTAALLNKMEQGIAGAGGGGLVVTVTESSGVFTLDKTWGEIAAAAEVGPVIVLREDVRYGTFIERVRYFGTDNSDYWVGTDFEIESQTTAEYVAASESGYPSYTA